MPQPANASTPLDVYVVGVDHGYQAADAFVTYRLEAVCTRCGRVDYACSCNVFGECMKQLAIVRRRHYG